MKTVCRRNMVNREMKLAIGEELHTLFHPIVSATKQVAEKTAEELVPVKKALEESSTTTYNTSTLTTTEGSHIWYTCNWGWTVCNGEQYSAYRKKQL